jgi:cell division protease FtsH
MKYFAYILLCNIMNVYGLAGPRIVYRVPLSFKNLLSGIEKHDFNRVYFDQDMQHVTAIETDNDKVVYDTTINPIVATKIVDASIKNNVEAVFIPRSFDFLSFTMSAVYAVVAFSIARNIFAMFGFMSRNNQFGDGTMRNPFDMNRKPPTAVETNVTFTDWAGSEEVLQECTEIVTYLKNDTFLKEVDAQLPRGILLEGPPGTGKTLLAKAIATESNSTFFTVSGSEFIEMFVGLGAMRVRNLFDEARKFKPSIIFIDEIDAIGRQRGRATFSNGGNEEREQTLNQLLTEMDGFKNNDGIIVIAATNRVDILDSALLRPGRFDRTIRIPLPDMKSRKAILNSYLKNKKVDDSVDVGMLSKMTNGYSGAQLKNLVNEAAIFAARNQTAIINSDFLEEAFEKLIIGIKKTVDTRDFETKKRVAIHEMGHAFIAAFFKDYFELQKISIQPSYSGVGGFTVFSENNESDDDHLYTKDMFMKRLMVALGGKAAEYVFYGDNFVSLGATMDLNQANSLANNMIEKYGMGNKLKVFYKDDNYGKQYSVMTTNNIDKEVADLVNEAYNASVTLLEKNKDVLEVLVGEILHSTTMNETVFREIIDTVICDRKCDL